MPGPRASMVLRCLAVWLLLLTTCLLHPSRAAEVRPVSLEWVSIPGGEFSMGSTEEDDDCRPIHRVRVHPFRISRDEVTHAQYAAFLAASGRKAPVHWGEPRWSGDAQPVIGVSWDDAEAFCRWAGGRLPTEAEWEFAARGAEGRRYPWGNQDPDKSRAVFHLDVGFGQTAAVGSAPTGATPLGVRDLAGNVFEWCADWYDAAYYAHSPQEDPAGPSHGTHRVIRGGSWLSLPDALHAAARGKYPPGSRSVLLGIRVAQ